MTVSSRVRRLLPVTDWLLNYRRAYLADDVTAGLITAILLIPQGMAYAMLAGLPPEVGLYASILPPIVYALLGTSRPLSVGPVSVAALLVANALSNVGFTPGDPQYLNDALLLAAMTGGILLLMAVLKLGVLVNFLGHPVLSGFTSGAAVLIIISQLPQLTGIPLPESVSSIEALAFFMLELGQAHAPTLVFGVLSVAVLLTLKTPIGFTLRRLGASAGAAELASRTVPLITLTIATFSAWAFELPALGLAVVGHIPAGMPNLGLGFLDAERAIDLLPAAILIALIGYVESVSVAKVLAYRRRQRIRNNQELIALGGANIAAAVSGGMPVAGGFSRSMVNYAAGARTQLATLVAVVVVALAAMFFTPLFYYLPQTVLAAIIVVAVMPLIDWRGLKRTWRYDKADAAAFLATFFGVLVVDIETGLILGVMVAVGTFLWRSSRPHVAEVGRLPGTEQFRNVCRHETQTWPNLLLLRVDRSLFFANISHVEDLVAETAAERPELQHLVLICSAVNAIDHSAVESLEQLVESLREAGVTLHLAEVKGPVLDRLQRSHLLARLRPGRVFLSAEDAVNTLDRAADDSS
ncbi:sodium-independent anion transporter [Alkalilimnicola ehrlichii]|uniref:Sodium-independent anion transporter n=1 Tax=Alkalilimnicola ehrlichii TaxID=351052 RepID=A0A3E0WWW6_9GAMM|nr:sodium-independent anion transporter [Alkalilimnicola ehrlichii]RFA37500.1 sodium-independent anion transporter [Alkalilimnicola ehrlichii]